MRRKVMIAIALAALAAPALADQLSGYVDLSTGANGLNFYSGAYADYYQSGVYFGFNECFISGIHQISWDGFGPAGLIGFNSYSGKHYDYFMATGDGDCGTTYRGRLTADGSRSSCLSNAWGTYGVITQACASSCTVDCDPFDDGSGDGSPILVSFENGIDDGIDDFPLSGPDDPVMFDLAGTGQPYPLTWTKRGAKVGFLILDRNGDGNITTGAEMFGNFTPLADGSRAIPASTRSSNGYLALGMYDRDLNGGNVDGRITSADAVWSRLRVWVDANHDGISQSNEIKTLDELGITEIGYTFEPTAQVDRYGNLFRFKGYAIIGSERVPTYDVFFQRADQASQRPADHRGGPVVR